MTLLPIPFDNPDTYPGHTGVDFGQSGGTPFRASGPGVVTVRGYSPRSGYTIWVRYDVGCEVGYVHMNSHRDCPAPGTRVVEGSFLGYVGGLGSNSTGYHLHVEVEGYSSTAGFWRWFTPNRVVGRGIPSKDTAASPAQQSEEDDMLFIRIKAANLDHYAVIGNGVFRHFVAGDPYEWIKNASRTDDNWVDVTLDRLPALLRTYGCDLHIWDVRDRQLVILDPLTGDVSPGNLWSAINVLRSQVAQVKVTSEQTAAYVAELAKAT